MKKKVLSVILSTAMIASVLAGCGGGSEAPAAQRQKRRQQILRQAVRKRLPGCSGMI